MPPRKGTSYLSFSFTEDLRCNTVVLRVNLHISGDSLARVSIIGWLLRQHNEREIAETSVDDDGFRERPDLARVGPDSAQVCRDRADR
jgi:hypothetical protein